MKTRLYKIISVTMTCIMLLSTTSMDVLAFNEGMNSLPPLPLLPMEDIESLEDTEPLEESDEAGTETSSDTAPASDAIADADTDNTPAGDAANPVPTAPVPAETTDDDRLTDLDKELIAAGATIPELKDLPEIGHEVHSLSDNPLRGRFAVEKGVEDKFFDPRESASSYLPPTRNQSPYGSCWAHSTVAIAEIQLIKSGKADTSINLSESQLVNNLYNSQLDPLGLSVGDDSRCVDQDGPLNGGGNAYLSTEMLTGWQGLVSESKDIYKYENAASLIYSGNNTAKAYYDDYHVQSLFRVRIPRGNEPEGRQEVKDLVRKYGAVAVSYYDVDAYYNQGYYYNNYNTSTNHAVTLVGWDDNIPASNFTNMLGEKPAGDGGWLIRNSWAVTDSKELSHFTYFWISYYDKSLSDTGYSVIAETASNYDNNYHYDRAVNNQWFSYSSGVQEANIFTAKASTTGETIEAVGFETGTPNLTYQIEVYKNLADSSNPESGTKVEAATTSGTTSYEGFYTVTLSSPVEVSYNEKFSIVVTFTGADRIPIYQEYGINAATAPFVISSHSGSCESFVKPAGSSWSDVGADNQGNLRIKAYTKNNANGTVPAQSIALNKTSISLCPGSSAELEVTTDPINAKPTLVWSSDNVSIATVDNGVITGVAVGECDIKVTADGNESLTAICHVTVSGESFSISITPINDKNEVCYGEVIQLGATITPTTAAKIADIKWTSSNESIISVDNKGKIEAKGFGTATITASIDSVSDSIELIVNNLQTKKVRMSFVQPDNKDILLEWDSVPGAVKYELMYAKDGAKYGTKINTVIENGNSYVFSNPDDNCTYQFYMLATSADDHTNGGYSTYGGGIYVGPLRSIRYELNGGTSNPANPNFYREGSNITLSLKDASKPGYRFYGWYADSGFTRYIREISSSSKGNYTLYARYTPYDYAIEYNANNGTSATTTSETYNSDSDITFEGTQFTKTGYCIASWNTKADGSGTSYAVGTTAKLVPQKQAEIIKLYAIWEKTGIEVTFDANGGTVTPASKICHLADQYGELPTPTRTGYNFDGWYTTSGADGTNVESSTTVTTEENHTLYAHWTAKDVTVTFDANGGKVDSNDTKIITQKYDAKYTLPAAPTKTGYTFAGWYTVSGAGSSVVDENTIVKDENAHTLYAHWTAAPVTVTFNANGGTPDDQEVVQTFDANYRLPSTTPTRTGYTFDGWYTDAEGGIKVTTSTKVTNSAAHDIYAHWKANQYDVTFDVNGGGPANQTIKQTYNAKYQLPASEPTKTGYVFAGWYTDSAAGTNDGTQVTTDTTVSITAAQTVYAHWTAKNDIKVTFNANNGQFADSTTTTDVDQTYDANYVLPTNEPTRVGYTFAGWYTSADANGSLVTAESTVSKTNDHTLYARWTANEYTITFNANPTGNEGATVTPGTATVTYGQAYGTLPTPVRPGYAFEGWYKEVAYTNKIKNTDIVNITANTTVYANWKAADYTVTFDNNDGTTPTATATVTYNGTYSGTLPSDPTREGYNFIGWFTEATGGEQVTDTTQVTQTANHTLYAHWDGKEYKVSFNVNGKTCATPEQITVKYGTTYQNLPDITAEGYTFTGWYTAATDGENVTNNTYIVSASDHTLYAHWRGASRTISFDPNSGSISESQRSRVVYVDSTYAAQENGNVPLPTPTRTGYAFDGWYTAATDGIKITDNTSVSASHPTTLYAHWSPEKYTVTFSANGQGATVTPATAQVEYGGKYITLPTPSRSGYTFDGWYTAAESGDQVTAETTVTATANHTLYAHWTAQSYTVTFKYNDGTVIGSPVTADTTATVTFGNPYGAAASGGALPAPTRKGYTFDGWFTQETGGTKVDATTIVNTANNHDLYAHWSVNTYTVTFAPGEGTCNTTSIDVTYGQQYGSLPSAIRAGYTFDGWFTQETDGTEIKATTVLEKDENHTLYAHWTAKEFTVTLNVNADDATALDPNTRKVAFDSAYGTLPTPIRDGYSFSGWYTEATGGTKVDATTILKTPRDHELYAHWYQPNVFVIARPAGYSATTVWVDGVERPTTFDGTNLTVTMPDGNGKIASIYKYAADGKPAGMESWLLSCSNEEYTATPLPEFSNLLGHTGFQARKDNLYGVRCVANIEKNTKQALKSTGVNGYTIEEMGFCYMQKTTWEGGTIPFTRGNATTAKTLSKSGGRYVDKVCTVKNGDASRKFFGGSIVTSTATKEVFKREYAFRSYAVLTKNGQQYIIYSAPISTSIYEVAKKFLDTGNYHAGDGIYEKLTKIVNISEQ